MTVEATTESYAYIAVRPCGCVTGVVVDEPEYGVEVAEDVAAFVRSGRKIERVTVAEAKERLTFDCEHSQPESVA